jgi:hypothetical protein
MKKINSVEFLSILALILFSFILLLIGFRVPFFAASVFGSLLLALFAFFIPNARAMLISLGYFFPLAVILVAQLNHLIIDLQPHTVDPLLSRLDGGLSVAIYRWSLQHATLHSVFWIVYYSLPIATALVLGLSSRRMPCFRAFVLAALFAPVFYYLVPAMGPAHMAQRTAPRNCFPSLHLTWALELVLYTQSHLRRIAVVYLALIAASTLGMGEHYMVDLVAAVPYTFAIYWLEARIARALPAISPFRAYTPRPTLEPVESTSEEVEVG